MIHLICRSDVRFQQHQAWSTRLLYLFVCFFLVVWRLFKSKQYGSKRLKYVARLHFFGLNGVHVYVSLNRSIVWMVCAMSTMVSFFFFVHILWIEVKRLALIREWDEKSATAAATHIDIWKRTKNEESRFAISIVSHRVLHSTENYDIANASRLDAIRLR